MIEKKHLLTDDQVISFIINGYLLVQPEFRPGLNEEVCAQFDKNGTPHIDLEKDPYAEATLTHAPAVREVFDHPTVNGAIISLIGERFRNFGWFCHATPPGGGGVFWHQDDINIRHHQVRRLTIMYYPQTVTPDMGPTYALPATHFWNTPTDRMANYGNFRHQVALTVPAGTLAFTHYDLWHTASPNTSSKTRYMVKLYSSRTEEPKAPTWNHDAATGDLLARRRIHNENPGLCSGSELYKERHLRWIAWQHMKGLLPDSDGSKAAMPGGEVRPLHRMQGYIGDPLV